MNRREWICLVFAAWLGSLDVLADSPEDPEMDGVWKPVSAELAGKAWPKGVLEVMKLTVKDGEYTVVIGEQSDHGVVERNAKVAPKTMDIKGTDGPNKGKTFLVIYELKGDELRVCYDLSGKSRPTKFATEPGTKLFLVSYRRAKP